MIDENTIAKQINEAFLRERPRDLGIFINSLDNKDVKLLAYNQTADFFEKLWFYLSSDKRTNILMSLPKDQSLKILKYIDVASCATILLRLPSKKRNKFLEMLDPKYSIHVKEYLDFPDDSAGKYMVSPTNTYHQDLTTKQVLNKIRKSKLKPTLYIYIVDNDYKLTGVLNIQKLLTGKDNQSLLSLSNSPNLQLLTISPKEEILERFEKSKLDSIPVVDIHGHLLGIIYYNQFIESFKMQITSDLQTMVGVSPEERALSNIGFSFNRRIIWLIINLFTAFLAASVVGLFEKTIEEVTALAILLPVVAGQSGNAGAQALAVTMRGLILREITLLHWLKVSTKEFFVGLSTGLLLAIICGFSVYVWNGSLQLSLVLSIAMIISVTAACVSGALVPIVLKMFSQDPAQSSSIILTTITDVVGFFSFLGIATLML